jgi:integrase/recombinase XerC
MVSVPGLNGNAQILPLSFATVAAARAGGMLAVSCAAARDLQQAAFAAGPDSFAYWAVQYLNERTVGASPHTFQAKARDLVGFALWFVQSLGETSLRAWRVADTHAYITELRAKGRAPKTINRSLGTLRNFARWAHDKHVAFACQGLPTADVSEIPEEEPPCRKLSAQQVRRLFRAGGELVRSADADRAHAERAGRANPSARLRPRRDLAMLALLYFTGLRSQELVMLRRAQFEGEALRRVARKGHNESRRVYVPLPGRELVEDYLANERGRDDVDGAAVALFLSVRGGRYLARQDLYVALQRIGAAAGVEFSAHVLRHTFGARYRAVSGSDTETASALGHRGLKYVGQYARATDDERDAMAERACEL